MAFLVNVSIHSSQFPENVRRDLLESLRARQINHKFHYDNVKQSVQWLALHEAYSPARTDPNCVATYDQSFASAINRIEAARVHLIGLGCGGGQKEVQLLRLLHERHKEIFYTPTDASLSLVLTAYQNALSVIAAQRCHPFVSDLMGIEDLPQMGGGNQSLDSSRLFTFFGLIPNFEPQVILPRLTSWLAAGDTLLLSANLAPGLNYEAGVQKILPLYDNTLTRDWLFTFLLDLGVGRQDGEIRFLIEECPANAGLKRLTANFHFNRPCQICLPEEVFVFRPGDAIRLFFSYRYTPDRVRNVLPRYGIEVIAEWITPSEEEGVFLCRKK